MSNKYIGVKVYNYADKEEDNEQAPGVPVLLTEDQTAEDMAKMLVESFGPELSKELIEKLQEKVGG